MPLVHQVLASAATFRLLGADHLVAVASTLAVIAAACLWGRRQSPAVARRGSRALAVGLPSFYALECIVRLGVLNEPPVAVLPLQICDVLFFIGAYAHWSRKQWAYDLLFFWTFAGTSQALATPALEVGAPELEYFRYFLSHGLLVFSAAYAAVVMQRTPQRGSLVRALLGLHAWALLVLVVDVMIGANFLYLLRKPEASTLLDHLGPWPWYLLGVEGVVVVTFALLNLPFAALRHCRGAPSQRPAASA